VQGGREGVRINSWISEGPKCKTATTYVRSHSRFIGVDIGASISVIPYFLTRVNSVNVLDEGLRIEGRGRQMKLKVKVSQMIRLKRIYNF
jgi:hypothetical protein